MPSGCGEVEIRIDCEPVTMLSAALPNSVSRRWIGFSTSKRGIGTSHTCLAMSRSSFPYVMNGRTSSVVTGAFSTAQR